MNCKKIQAESSLYNISRHPLAKMIKDDVYAETSGFPSNISYSKRIRAIAAESKCECKQCGIVHGDPDREFCSNKCYQIYRKEHEPTPEQFAINKAITKGEKKFGDKVEGVDYLVCAICGAKSGDLGSHVRMHDITPAEYKVKYSIDSLKPLTNIQNRMGDKNPAYNHGGKYSPWSKNFIHGYDKARHDAKNRHQKEMRASSPEKFKSNIEYWLSHCDGDEYAAKAAYKKFQTRDLAFFVEKYGEEEGIARHAAKTEKWIKSFCKQTYSNISQELFTQVFTQVPDYLRNSIYFATHQRPEMEAYVNKEYILKVEKTFIRPDFICLQTKRIIEFDGDYWHSPAKANPAREKLRDTRIINLGYTVLHVKEYEYKKDKAKVIQECLNFLTQ